MKKMTVFFLALFLCLGGFLSLSLGREQNKGLSGSIKVKLPNFSKMAKISTEDAKKIALKKYPTMKVVEVELEVEGGYLIYDVALVAKGKKVELKVDAGNGKILGIEIEVTKTRTDDDEKDEESEKDEENEDNDNIKGSLRLNYTKADYPSLAKISYDKAVKSAIKKVPGKLLALELENEDGFLVYEIKVVTKGRKIMEITVDAGNGKVLKVEVDDDQQKAGEDDDDNDHKTKKDDDDDDKGNEDDEDDDD